MTAHSPLGASAAERWMNCPGSVAKAQSIILAESADPEYRLQGTAAHAAIAHCLQGQGSDAWEIIGQKFEKVEIDQEMADAIQVFLDEVRPIEEACDRRYVEEHLDNPNREFMWGTIDFGAIVGKTLYVRDFKYGQGIIVETKGNVQMLYYAYLLLLKHWDAEKVNMRIMQPRIPYRNDDAWEVSADFVRDWAEKELFPAMDRTRDATELKAGEWCRFCPAKAALACEKLKEHFGEAAAAAPTVENYEDAALLADWDKLSVVKMHIRAIETEVMRRLMAGQMKDNGVCKLVHKKANRVWKPEAAALFKSRFGDQAYSEPELKTPAQMEKINSVAKELTLEYAFTPQAGYTVAAVNDKRPELKVLPPSETFAKVLDTLDL